MKKLNTFSRREFILGAGSAAALAAAAASGFAIESVPSDRAGQKKVLVLGAGLAGLAAAYELKKDGFDVTVLEAQTRPGGRVLTYRDPFADGLYAEMGAEYVDAADEYDHRYCKEFGLKVMTAKVYDAIFVRDKKIRMDSFKKNKEALPFEGTQPGVLFGQEMAYTKPLWEKLQNEDQLPPEILKLDNLSVAQLLAEQGAPEDVTALYTYLNATESTARPDEMSALTMIKSNLHHSDFSEVQDEGRILGGNDQLPKAFARALSDQINYRKPVRKIAHGPDGVEVWYEDEGKLNSVRSPYLVIAIPFKVLRNIEILPAFSAAKMNCIRTLAYGHVMKIAMQYKQRFWDQQGSLGQRVFTDTKLRRIYHMSLDQPGPRGILMSFTSGKDAEELGKLEERECMKIALEESSKVWSEAPVFFEGGATKYWNDDPWIQGSYSFTGVGQERDFLQIAQQPEGRVHFAGEHTSVFRASMNGAIESGVRASSEIIKSV